MEATVAEEPVVEKSLRGVGSPEYFVVRPPQSVREDVRNELGVWARIGKVVERLNANLRRVVVARGLNDALIQSGLNNGTFRFLTKEELLAELPRDSCGAIFTAGGDCGGIADCLAELARELDPSMAMVGVRNAGEGLVRDPLDFDDALVPVDPLLADDWRGQSSTPLGSARLDPLKTSEGNVLNNLRGRPFIAGTGGNGGLSLFAALAKKLPDTSVVVTPKSVDGDICVNGKPAMALGFNSAVAHYRDSLYSTVQSAAAHGQVDVVEVFGRNSGRLVFESARSDVVNSGDWELSRKVEEFGDTVMILVPEKPVSLKAVAEEVKRRKRDCGSCVVMVAEGFLPPEMDMEIEQLSKDVTMGMMWKARALNHSSMLDLLQDQDLKQILSDQVLAHQFANLVWNRKYDEHGTNMQLSGVRHFIIGAIKTLAGIGKVNEVIKNYDGRGATPTEFDQNMGRMVGRGMAEVVNSRTKGVKVVVYFEGMNPFNQQPVVVDLNTVSADNNLSNSNLYPEDTLRRGGVFW